MIFAEGIITSLSGLPVQRRENAGSITKLHAIVEVNTIIKKSHQWELTRVPVW